MPSIEDRIASLETNVTAELKSLRARVVNFAAAELTWGQKHWGWVALGALVAGVVLGAVIR